jgi:hypothetical protein
MGQNIKDFKSWQRINEDSYFGWLGDLLSSAVTGEDTPAKPADAKSEAKPEEKKTDKEVKTTPIKREPAEKKEYSDKIKKISDKLGDPKKITTVDPDSTLFIALDLNKPENVQLYANICQEWIDIRKPLAAKVDDPISGEDFAEAAAYVYRNSGVYVPPQLVLAQATLEGGFAKTRNKPIDTKNIFNVGNTDDGSIKSFDAKGNAIPGGDPNATWKGGIIAYFNLLANRYLVPGKRTADDLVLGEFVNVHGNRYASSKEYEKGLLNLIDDINTRVVA